jgi:hypothetical protein
MLAQALEEGSSRAAMAIAQRVQGRSVNLAMQSGAKPGAALLANLLERDLIRGGAAAVVRRAGGKLQLRVLLKAHGLEEAPLASGVEVTAFIDADLRLLDANGRELQAFKVKVQRVEKVDGRGFRTKVDAAGEDWEAKEVERAKRAAQGQRRRSEERKTAAAQPTRPDRRRDNAAIARRDAEARVQREEAARQLAEQERQREKAAKKRHRDDARAAEEARQRAAEDDRIEPRKLAPRPQLDHASHCARAEQILFSCRIRGAQIVSLCASPDLGRRRGWLQYRFGTKGKVSSSFPEDRAESRASFTFEQVQEGEGLGIQNVIWTLPGRRYELWVRQVDPFAEEGAASAGLKLFKKNALYRDWKCVSEYVEDLRTLDGIVLDPE